MTLLLRAALAVIAILYLMPGCSERPRALVIDVQNFAYMPAQGEFAPGDTVVFVNHDMVPHTATSRDKSWDTGEIAAGDTARVVIRTAGEYYCVYHPNMLASVVLTER